MNYKKKNVIILLLSILGLFLGAILTSPSSFGLCSFKDKFCLDPYDELIGQPLGLFSFSFFVISLIFLSQKEQTFKSWSKFTMIFLPIAVILIAVTPAVQGSFIGFDREEVTLGLAIIFFVASLLIIAVNYSKMKGDK